MDLLFKIATGIQYQNAIIGDTDFKRFYPEVNINLPWADIEPYIEQATDTYIIPFVGDAFYAAIATKVKNNTALTNTETEYLRLLKRAVAYYTAMYSYSKKLDIATSIGNIQDNVQGANSTPQWAFRQKLLDLTKTADMALDKLLTYLNAQSLLVTNGKTAPLFRTLAEFEEFHDLNGSHKTFRSLRTLLNDAISQYIAPKIGADTMNIIKTQYTDDNLSTPNAALLPYIQRAAAKFAVALACNMPAYTVEGAYLFAMSNTEGYDGRNENQKLQSKALTDMGQACTNIGERYLEDLINFLVKNVTDYPLFQAEKYPGTAPRQEKVIISDDNIGGLLL